MSEQQQQFLVGYTAQENIHIHKHKESDSQFKYAACVFGCVSVDWKRNANNSQAQEAQQLEFSHRSTSEVKSHVYRIGTAATRCSLAQL